MRPAPPETPAEVEEVKVCSIVEEILNENNGTTKVGECNPKTEGTYPGWDCQTQSMNTENDGACMPPRRIKLCLFYVADNNEKKKNTQAR